MTYLLMQTFLLLLASYFLGALAACVVKRMMFAPARVGAAAATAGSGDGFNVPGRDPAAPPMMVLPRDFERVQPKIDIIARPEPHPPPRIADISRFDRALSGPELNEGMPRVAIVEIRPAVLDSVTGPAAPWPPPKPYVEESAAPDLDDDIDDVPGDGRSVADHYSGSVSSSMGAAGAHAAAAAAAISAARAAVAQSRNADVEDDDDTAGGTADELDDDLRGDSDSSEDDRAFGASLNSDDDDADHHDDDDVRGDADADRDLAAREDDEDDEDHVTAGVETDDDEDGEEDPEAVGDDTEDDGDDDADADDEGAAQATLAGPAIPGEPITDGDDLQRIRAIDADTEQKLKINGFLQFEDIARWTPDDIDLVDAGLDLDGRIDQEQWVEQAQILAKGGETYYSRNRAAAVRAAASSPRQQTDDTPAAGSDDAPRDDDEDPEPAGAAGSAAGGFLTRDASGDDLAGASDDDDPDGDGDGDHDAGSSDPDDTHHGSDHDADREPLAGRDGDDDGADDHDNDGDDSESKSEPTPRSDDTVDETALVDEPPRVMSSEPRSVSELAAGAAAAIAAASASVTRGIRPIEPISPLSKVDPNIRIPARLTDAIRDQENRDAEQVPDDDTTNETLSSATGDDSGGRANDLKRIRGIGVLIEKRLNALGVWRYEQIANWTSGDIDRVSRSLEFKGRIEREKWVEQARILASGGNTEFSRRVDRGEHES